MKKKPLDHHFIMGVLPRIMITIGFRELRNKHFGHMLDNRNNREEKIVHTACHHDSRSMNLMFLTPHRRLIGHSQETCVLWINCSQIILRRKLFYFCFAVLPVSYWQLDRAWNKKQFLWIIAVNLSRSLIKVKNSMWKHKEIGSS